MRETFRVDRRRPDVHPHQGSRCTTSAPTSTSTPTKTRCTPAAASTRPSPSCARPATSTRRTAQPGCAPPTSVTTRTASSSRATATRPTSPPTSPTTWTSAQRGFDLCIYMLGADHHGYIARLKAAAAALGDDPATVEVLIGQMVNLVRDGQPVRMSKRAGTVITLDDLVEAIGVDAARYSLIRSRRSTRPIDIDLALWSSASSENPVYYVQYAHARLSALARNAAELGLAAGHRAPRAAHARQRGHADPQHRRVPAGAENRCRAAGTAPGVAATSKTWPATTTGSTTPAGCCRRATKSPATCTPHGWRCARPPARSSPTGWASSASPLRSGCESRTPPAPGTPRKSTTAAPRRVRSRRISC